MAEPEVVKLKRDAIDFEEYGGTVAPRSNSVLPRNHKQSVSLREYRADQYDFTEAMPRWVNRDPKQCPAYKFLSTRFKKLFDSSKVVWDLNRIGKGCCNTHFWIQRIHARIPCAKSQWQVL